MRERESKAGFVGLALLAGTTWLVRSVAELVGGVAVFLVALAAAGFLGALLRYLVVGQWGI